MGSLKEIQSYGKIAVRSKTMYLHSIYKAMVTKIEGLKNKMFSFKKSKTPHVTETSNIIQLDDMGYPLMLCIMSDGDQRWIDVSEEFADKGVKNGSLHIIKWHKSNEV